MDVTALQSNDYNKGYQPTKNSNSKNDSDIDTTTPAAVYSKTVDTLKSELADHQAKLENSIIKLLTNQGQIYNNSLNIWDMLRSGKLNIDPTMAQAAQDEISEDGYWGVEKTSDRLVDMAIALSGGDKSKADEMIGAMEKGFKQATKAWGDTLPDICQKTIDTAIEKMENWKTSEL